MGLTSGTPIWLSILIALGAVLATHFLTQWRESGKRKTEILTNWRRDADRLLTDIVDAATDHYSNPSSIATTQLSAQKLLTQLKRFGSVMRQVRCKDPADSKRTADLIAELHTAITNSDDFFTETRAVLSAQDPLLAEILGCEQGMRQNLALPRTLLD